MTESKRPETHTDDVAAPERLPYEPPRIAWREPYEPVASAVSCAKQPGNPPCNVGPTSA